MSYILEAIKKAEREREQSQFLDAHEEIFASVPKKTRTSFSWQSWLLLAIMIGLNVLLMMALFSPKKPLTPPLIYFSASPNETVMVPYIPPKTANLTEP
jgi:cytoskeletal protein RodZ